jgi:hypothetical protein
MLSSCGAPANVADAHSLVWAHTIVQGWWPREEAAFISGQATALNDLYSGTALEVAEGQMTMETLRNSRPKYPRPFRGSVVFAPSGSSQSWFLAIIQYAPVDQDGRAEPVTTTAPGLIFTQMAGTWNASAADVQAPIPHDLLGNGDSILSAPLTDDHYFMAASSIATSYATYVNLLSGGQQPVAPFPTGLNTFAWSFTRIPWPPGSIATAQFKFEVVDAKIAAYSITVGYSKVPEVVIFSVRRTVVIMPRHGCLVRQANDLEWSAVVPPGSYSSVTITSLAVVAASVPLNDGDVSQGRKIIDIGGPIDDIRADGQKC